jgi:2-polyprenyl-3-methyl-5-hydroxy-6-metoxy-1,4-benzoquinol methylase
VKTFDIGDRGEDRRAVRCCLCGSDRYRPYLRSRGFTFVKCRGCGLVYQNPQPAPEGLHERYGERYFRYELENDRNFFSLMQLGLQDIGFYDIPMDRFDNDRFLDVGCATGMLVEEMQNRGWDARGVEICRESARFGIQKRGVRIFAGTLEEAGFADGEFAVVHFSHLIEHVADPLGLLREVKRILSPNGVAVVTTPNVEGFQARLFGSRWRSAISDHLTLFSKRTLKRMLEKAGYSVVRGVTWGGLAKGTAPLPLKRAADALAKKLGFGDVVLYEAAVRRPNAS